MKQTLIVVVRNVQNVIIQWPAKLILTVSAAFATAKTFALVSV
jgi:hypothetical protein